MCYRRERGPETTTKFYLVPLGEYFRRRRQTKSRETILGEYAFDALESFRKAIPADVISG